MGIKLNKWKKEWLANPRSREVKVSRKMEGKSYAQAFGLVEFMKSAELGKAISIITPEGGSVWKRVA